MIMRAESLQKRRYKKAKRTTCKKLDEMIQNFIINKSYGEITIDRKKW